MHKYENKNYVVFIISSIILNLLIVSLSMGETYALLVGCSDYPGTESDLDYVPTNIQNVSQTSDPLLWGFSIGITSWSIALIALVVVLFINARNQSDEGYIYDYGYP